MMLFITKKKLIQLMEKIFIFSRDQIEITNSLLTLVLKFKTVFEREIWYNEINTRAQLNLKILKENKYQTYTNEKTKNKAH